MVKYSPYKRFKIKIVDEDNNEIATIRMKVKQKVDNNIISNVTGEELDQTLTIIRSSFKIKHSEERDDENESKKPSKRTKRRK